MTQTNTLQILCVQLDEMLGEAFEQAEYDLLRLMEIDAQSLAVLTQSQAQFFANDYARRLFVFDHYAIDASLRQEMFLIRARSKAALHDMDEQTLQKFCRRFAQILLRILRQILEHVKSADTRTDNIADRTLTEDQSRSQHDTVTSSKTHLQNTHHRDQRQPRENGIAGLPEQLGKSSVQGTGSTSDMVQTELFEYAMQEGSAGEDPVFRLYVDEFVRHEDQEGQRRALLRCRTADQQLVELVLWDEHAQGAEDFWPGSTLHLTSMRRRGQRQLHSSAHSLVVLEPDVLIDVTDVAECFQSRGVEPLVYFVRRLSQPRSSQSLAVGALVNYCFDELLHDEACDFDRVFDQGLRAKPLGMLSCIAQGEVGIVKELVREQFEGLREVCAQWRDLKKSTEPSFLSPTYGLQGRLDLLLEYPGELHRRTVVELKSGSAPAIHRGAGSSAASLWTNHLAQVSCYNLLLDSSFPGRTGDSQILYARTKEHPLRNAPNDVKSRQQVLRCRNRIVALEHQLIQRNFRLLNLLRNEELQLPPFMQNDIESLRYLLKSMHKIELRYFQAFYSYLLREQYAQRVGAEGNGRGFAALWTDTLQEKSARMTVLADLSLNEALSDFHNMHLVFELGADRNSAMTLREGDLVVLRAQRNAKPGPMLGQVLKASLRRLSADQVEISLRNKSTEKELLLSESQWLLEADYMESSMNNVYAWFMRFFLSDSDKRQRILGLAEPRRLKRATVHEAQLTDLQNTILNEALAAQDYYLLQGPPGTGKTSVMLRHIVKHLLDNPEEQIIVAAFTNRAVDEMCSALRDLCPRTQLLRMGKMQATEHEDILFSEQSDTLSLDERRSLLANARIVACTVAFLHSNPELMELTQFSSAIIDEASQIGEAQLVGVVASVDRFILIGDEKQLPAVVTQSEAQAKIQSEELSSIGLHDLRCSLFERLLERCRAMNWSHAHRMLEQQARMHASIQNIASQLYYHSRLQPLLEWQKTPALILSNEQQSIADILDQERLIYISTKRERLSKRNLQEARVCAAIVEHIAHREGDKFSSRSVGVISPFRAQNREIQSQLPSSISSTVSIDTVERFQGSERDSIVFSASLNSVLQLRSIQSLSIVDNIEVDRKLNVAITRARQQFFLVGNETILRESVHYQRLIEYILVSGKVVDADHFLETTKSVR